MDKKKLIDYLEKYLKINDYKDTSRNGIQIDNSRKEIKKIGYAVDASNYIIQKAIKEKVDMLIVHHGFLWGQDVRIIGLMYENTCALIKNDICLCGYHLPLDAHSQVGNNIGIAKEFIKKLKIKSPKIEQFGQYRESTIGYGIKFKQAIKLDIFKKTLKDMGFQDTIYNFGNKKELKSIAIVSGGGGQEEIKETKDKGYDIFLTGELAHRNIIEAKQLGVSVVLSGHRETETVGVKLLAQHIEKKFKVKTVFLDEKY